MNGAAISKSATRKRNLLTISITFKNNYKTEKDSDYSEKTNNSMWRHPTFWTRVQVLIEYRESGESYDILITTKDGTNVKPENQLDADKYYKSAYLVGSTKERATEHVDASNAAFPELNWELSWDNE